MTERIARSRGSGAARIPLGNTYPVLDDTLITGEIPLLLTKLSLLPYEPPRPAGTSKRPND